MQSSQKKRQQKQGEYEVDRIVDRKNENGKVFYKVRWVNFSPSDDSWEPVENLANCKDIIRAFEAGRTREDEPRSSDYKQKQTKTKDTSKQKDLTKIKQTAKAVSPPANSLQTKKVQNVPSKAEGKTTLLKYVEENTAEKAKHSLDPPKTTQKGNPLAVSRVKKLFDDHKANTLKSTIETPTNRPEAQGKLTQKPKNLAVSQVSQARTRKGGAQQGALDQTNLKRSLARHLNVQEEDYGAEIEQNGKGRKVAKRLSYIDQAYEETSQSARPLAETKIDKADSFPKSKAKEVEKNAQTREKSAAKQKEIATQFQSLIGKGNQKDKEALNKAENNGIQSSKLKKSLFNNEGNISRGGQAQEQEEQNNNNSQEASLAAGSEGKLFGAIYRYNRLDECLLMHKKMAIRNMFHKEEGRAVEKARIKLLDIGEISVYEKELVPIRRVVRPTRMDKLELLMKLKYGWVAVGKNEEHGIFMMDVNLLQHNVWKVIEEMYQI